MDEQQSCLAFATLSAPTQNQKDFHDYGKDDRTKKRVLDETFRGKSAEVVMAKFLAQYPLSVGVELDFKIYPAGIGDSGDLIVNSKVLSVASTKPYGEYLLIERTKAIREKADYYCLVKMDETEGVGQVEGFIGWHEMVTGPDTLHLKAGDYLPGTNTALKVDNYATHRDSLYNSAQYWIEMADV